jgi:hypothetical protein
MIFILINHLLIILIFTAVLSLIELPIQSLAFLRDEVRIFEVNLKTILACESLMMFLAWSFDGSFRVI